MSCRSCCGLAEDGAGKGRSLGVGGGGNAFEDVFGEEGDLGEGDAGGVLDGVEDGGGGAVHGELAYALGAAGAVDAGGFFEVDVDRRQIGAGRHDVVGHLVIAHQ